MQGTSKPQVPPRGAPGRSHKAQAGGGKAKPRPMRCGECHSCKNPRLKKGCLRNQALRSRGIDPASISAQEAPRAPAEGTTSSPRSEDLAILTQGFGA